MCYMPMEEKVRIVTGQCDSMVSQLTTMLGFLGNEQLFSTQFRTRARVVTNLVESFRGVHMDIRDTVRRNQNLLEKFTEQEISETMKSIAYRHREVVVAWTNLATLSDCNEGLEHELTNLVRLEKIFFCDEEGWLSKVNGFYCKLIAEKE